MSQKEEMLTSKHKRMMSIAPDVSGLSVALLEWLRVVRPNLLFSQFSLESNQQQPSLSYTAFFTF